MVKTDISDCINKKRFTACISRHFLFNTLNASIALCRKSPKEASKVLICLSDCIIYTSEKKSPLVLLTEELEYIYSYLYIQSVRFDSRLDIIYDIDKNAQCKIPPYALQVIIDNIFHNVLMKSRKKVIIKLSVMIEENTVNIMIGDNGKGMTEEQIKDILSESNKQGTLCKLNKMLKENKMDIEIVSSIGKGTNVMIRTPRI